MAEQLGLDPTQVTSPTFTLIDEHDLPDGRILIHVDAWRLGSDEVSELGLQEHLSSDRTIVAIEWAQRIADVLPPDHVKIVIEILDPERRSITITPMGDAACVIESPGVCPVCNEEASVATAPFCTSRCRLVDLGQWFDGRHVIHRPIGEDDLLE
jgi:tRNA threonylcarbamoyl adenosine modification protein YjeE